MKNDIIPPKLPRPGVLSDDRRRQPEPIEPHLPDVTDQLPAAGPAGQTPERPRRSLRIFMLLICGVIGFVVLAAAAAGVWYMSALRPVSPSDHRRERIIVAQGSSLAVISEQLEQKNLIRSRLAFRLYARFSGAGARLQAGTYSISPSESPAEIIDHFVSGAVDKISLTFLPGATLRHLQGDTGDTRYDIESVLRNAGYEQAEIEAAFSKRYNHPLFDGKPQQAGLEGYIYGETYTFNSSVSVEQILEATFDEYYRVIEKNNLIAGYKAQGLSLFEGITLASIIQREVKSEADQKQVAQIFLSRLKQGMTLGSDVTYIYAAKKAGVQPSPDFDSPYNTRKVVGLPPGPIATPGLGALKAVAAPAPGDYLYFLSGDDSVTYFGRTIQEHEANIRNHCQKMCSE